jgi:large subunit ribosomal protein L30
MNLYRDKKTLQMTKVKITQVKSISGQSDRQRRTVEALGLKKMHQTVEKELTPQIQGMIQKVQHLVKVENA